MQQAMMQLSKHKDTLHKKQANGQAMTITDAYIEVLILLVRFSEKEVYKTVNEAMKDQVESEEYTAFEFLSFSITIDQW